MNAIENEFKKPVVVNKQRVGSWQDQLIRWTEQASSGRNTDHSSNSESQDIQLLKRQAESIGENYDDMNNLTTTEDKEVILEMNLEGQNVQAFENFICLKLASCNKQLESFEPGDTKNEFIKEVQSQEYIDNTGHKFSFLYDKLLERFEDLQMSEVE